MAASRSFAKNLDAKDKSLEFPALFLNSAWLPGEPQTLITAGLELDGNNLWQTNLKTGERQKITDFQAERLDQFAISPDGKQFVVSRGLETYNAVLIE